MLDMKGTDRGATSRDLEREEEVGNWQCARRLLSFRTPELGHQKLASVVQ